MLIAYNFDVDIGPWR